VRSLGIFVLAVTLLGCASREVAYRRSLAARHLSDFARRLPRSDFDQIAEILSHRSRQSITDIQPFTSDQVIVYTAFPGTEGPGLSSEFILAKRDGRWHVVESKDETVLE
jgi:hypothetical protein